MKVLQYLVSLVFFLAGVALLVAPLHAAVVPPSVAAQGFVPTRFTVVDAGTVGKPDVVLIPGLSSSRAVWDGEVAKLAPNYRLHVLQVNGFGGSPAGPNASGPLLAPLVEELHAYIAANKMQPAVMGHSMGGLLTLMLADKYPQDVSKIVIVDALPYYAVLFNAEATPENMKPQTEIIKQQMSAMPDDQYAAMQPMLAAQMVKDPEAQKTVAGFVAQSNRAVVLNAMTEDLLTDMRGEVAKIKTPALVLFAVDASTKQPDPAVYEAMVRSAYKPMPNVTLVKVDGSRHFIMYDQPGKLDEAVEGFLK